MKHLASSIAVVLCISMSAMSPAWADDGTNAAKEHFKNGTLAYDLGHYAEAAAEYEAAYKAKNDPALLFNLGQAYRAAGDYANAIRVYRSFLRRVPVSPDRETVEARIVELQAKIDAEQATKPNAEPTPAATTAPPPSVALSAEVSARPPEHAKRPLYRRWWVWTLVGAVAVGGVAAAVIVTTVPKNAAAPAGSPIIAF